MSPAASKTIHEPLQQSLSTVQESPAAKHPPGVGVTLGVGVGAAMPGKMRSSPHPVRLRRTRKAAVDAIKQTRVHIASVDT
jgi:hypothetical protein